MRFIYFIPCLIYFLAPQCENAFGSVDTINQIDENKLKQGWWIFYGEDKRLPDYGLDSKVEEGRYVDNRKFGKWTKYYASGEVQNVITYANSRPRGVFWVYYKDGTLKEGGTWLLRSYGSDYARYNKNGCITYKHDGEIYYEYSGTNCDSLSQRYRILKKTEPRFMTKLILDAEGNITDTVHLREVKWYSIDEKGVITWDSQQNLYHQFDFKPKSDRPRDVYPTYNEAGDTVQYGRYNKHDQLVKGKWYKYDANGKLLRIEIYKRGKYIGTLPMDN